jgi:hypothetical protein
MIYSFGESNFPNRIPSINFIMDPNCFLFVS